LVCGRTFRMKPLNNNWTDDAYINDPF